MKQRILILTVVLGGLLLAQSAAAQPRPDKNWKSWFGHFDGSWSSPQGDAGNVLNDGWSLGGGATYWPETWPVGVIFDLDYNEFNFSREAIDFINDQPATGPEQNQIDGGDMTNWALSIDGTWSPSDTGSGFYLIGGVSANFLEARLKSNGLVYYPPICSPWYWWCVPGGVGPGTIIRGSQSETVFGYHVGVGWAVEVGLGSQIYFDVRYQIIETSPVKTELIPFTVGYRW
jgi:hypothetical protein